VTCTHYLSIEVVGNPWLFRSAYDHLMEINAPKVVRYDPVCFGWCWWDFWVCLYMIYSAPPATAGAPDTFLWPVYVHGYVGMAAGAVFLCLPMRG